MSRLKSRVLNYQITAVTSAVFWHSPGKFSPSLRRRLPSFQSTLLSPEYTHRCISLRRHISGYPMHVFALSLKAYPFRKAGDRRRKIRIRTSGLTCAVKRCIVVELAQIGNPHSLSEEGHQTASTVVSDKFDIRVGFKNP